MNIIFVTGYFAKKNREVLTGMPNYIYKVCKILNQSGHCAVILTVGEKNKSWKYDGIKVHSIKLNSTLDRLQSPFMKYGLKAIYRDCLFQKKIRELNQEYHFDLIQYAGWYGVGMLHHGKIPGVLRLSTYVKFQMPDNHTSQELATITKVEQMAGKRADAVFAPSNVLGQAFAKDIKRKVATIETPFFNEVEEKTDKAFIEKNKMDYKYILFFGRLCEDKGLFVIAKMLNQFLKKHSDYRLVCAGMKYNYKGKDSIQILKEAAGDDKDRVIYLGELSHKDLYAVIENSKVVILPSLMDNFPNTCQEAMSFGKIVIGTEGTSFEQLIEDGKSGFLAKPGDENSLLVKIQQALELSKSEQEAMEEKAKQRIGELSPEVTVPKLLRFYKYIISKKVARNRK